MRHAFLVSIAVLALSLCGCQTIQYRIGQESYSSAEQALHRLEQINSDVLASISPTTTPIHATAKVVIPTLDRIQRTGIKMTGKMTADFMRKSVDYSIKSSDKNSEFMFKAIEKRKIFDSVSLIRNPSPEEASAEGCDYVIYLVNPNPDLIQWYVKGKDWKSGRPIHFDASKPLGTARTISWLDNLEESVRSAPAN